jgi:lipid II:glycine glycyltransferase (peptidoglycan interpeptide bridge formation enzyme)
LKTPEDVLWKNIDRITRQNIKSAINAGVVIREAVGEEIEGAYNLIKDTFGRSKIPFMGQKSFYAYLSGLDKFGKLLVAEHEGVVQSCCVLAYSDYCVYAVYAGNLISQQHGSNKLLYWEAIRQFKNLGVRIYDFVGARINPEKGSKEEALSHFKKRFGAELKRGYIWRYPFRPFKYQIYSLAAFLRSGGDIVSAERHKLKSVNPADK